MGVISEIAGSVLKPVGDYFARKMEIKAQDRQQERAIKAAMVERQIDLIKEGLHADMQWEVEMAKQAATSWKDEYTLLVISTPAVLCFIPKSLEEWQGGAYYVSEGFQALQQTPMWYQILFCSMFAATFGIRWWRRSQSDT
jgi:hypothetical protein